MMQNNINLCCIILLVWKLEQDIVSGKQLCAYGVLCSV